MRLLTIGIQVGLVFAAVLVFIKLVQAELDERRAEHEHREAMRGKSAWKP